MGNIETIDPNLNKPIDEVQKTFDGSVTQNPQTTTLATINTSDTISQFMEKVNNNFTTIISMGGGPAGVEGEKGDPGAPTKPKVPIHVWVDGVEYNGEKQSSTGCYYIDIEDVNENLSDIKYQEGHIIMLQNAHVYRLELNNETYKLEPKFLIALQSYDPSSVVNGKTAYMHIAYSNSDDGSKDFITDKELRENTKNNISGGTEVIDPELGEPITPFSLKNTTTDIEDNIQGTKTYKANYQYMGIYCDNDENPKTHQSWYTWFKIRGEKGDKGIQGETGPQGPQGKQGEKGDKGDNFTGHSYTIDLEGDMSMIPINIDRKTNGSCKCVLHAYYGNNNVKLDKDKVEINISEEYKNIGVFEKEQSGNDVIIKFKPDENFVFPTTTIMFTIHVDDTVLDTSDNKIYRFFRDTVWMVKGIVSTFSLEIIPNSRTIKLDENGNYTPEKLEVQVYKIENRERTIFNFDENQDFQFLYKNINENQWKPYPNNGGISTKGISCLEFKVVNTNKIEEIWDYEDVWVVADGKSTHYYHADLGTTESMMVLTTGEESEIIGNDGKTHKCAKLKSKTGYSLTFDPKFFDGSNEIGNIININIGSNSGEEYYNNGTFVRVLNDRTLTVEKVPAGVDVIPMNIVVEAESQDNPNIIIQDIVPFNIYISTLSDIYTLIPSESSYNTSTGKNGDKIRCDVFKNNTYINISELEKDELILKYIIRGSGTDRNVERIYSNDLVFGNEGVGGFIARDVAIEFILYKSDKEIFKSTVPLIKDGINGVDGNSWQYIFCRSSKYPFESTGISNPNKWTKDPKPKDSNSEYLGDKEDDFSNDENLRWYDEHKGVDSKYRYEYQSYRKWDRFGKCWSKYTKPTLYSNYSESGNGYSVILSNPIAVIPVGNDGNWSTNEDISNQHDSTLVYLYNNITDISKFENVTIELPKDNIYVQKGNFTIDKYNDINQILFNPSVNGSVFSFDQNNQYKLPIKLTYDLGSDIDGDGYIDKFTTTIYWTLSPLKGIEDVELYVDKHIVNISESNTHTLKVGYDLTSNGSKTSIRSNNENENIKQYIIGFTENIEQTPKVITDWNNATYTFVDDNGNTKNCYVVLLNSNEKTIIDYDIITVVNNGIDGENGKDGVDGKDGEKGEDGKDGTSPTCTKVEIIGYSKENLDINDTRWVATLQLLKPNPGDTIYILNEYTWNNDDNNKTKGVTVTIAGTQGIKGDTGKSRVLFYLGSFKDGTLEGDTVEGLLTDDRCDYFIDSKGNAWMRRGDLESVNGNYVDQKENAYWVKAETVGFLKAGAIHADMINTRSLVADTGFISDLTANEAFINSLTVDAANITGTLTVGVGDAKIKVDDIVNGINSETNTTVIDGGKIKTGSITANQIKTDAFSAIKISADQITSGTIDSKRINVDDLTVKQLNTDPSNEKSNIIISDNNMTIYDLNNSKICSFSDNNLGYTSSNAFNTVGFSQKTFKDWDKDASFKYLPSLYGAQYDLQTFEYYSTIRKDLKDGELLSGYNIKFKIELDTSIDLTDAFKNAKDLAHIQIGKTPIVKIFNKKDLSKPIATLNYGNQYVRIINKGDDNKKISQKYNATYLYTIPEDGEYSFSVGSKSSLACFNITNYINLEHIINSSNVNVTYGNISNENCLTMICRDGMLINNNTNGMVIAKDGIIFKFGDYGLKINVDGIHYSTKLGQHSSDLNSASWSNLINMLNK